MNTQYNGITVKFYEFLGFCGYECCEDGLEIMMSSECMSSYEAAELAEESAEWDYVLI
jgi:hypothetical protein